MKIAFVINQTHKESANYTTTLLALRALQRGHDVYYIGLADFYYDQATAVAAHMRHLSPNSGITDQKELINTLRQTSKKLVNLQAIDVLWLRFDPAIEIGKRPWAAETALQFAELAQKEGVLVINRPESLVHASNKLYLENFDESIRPRTLVTRSFEDIERFLQQEDKIILKPLKGSGGTNVFLIERENAQNLKQTVEAIARDGYIIAQEYLPEARNGDIRFFLLEGMPIRVNGHYAAVRRVQKANEIRSNVHQGGSIEVPHITEQTLNVAQLVSERLKKDGMYLVGLDIVGNKIMEINVYSPGALHQAEVLTGQDFATPVIAGVEQKVATSPKNQTNTSADQNG